MLHQFLQALKNSFRLSAIGMKSTVLLTVHYTYISTMLTFITSVLSYLLFNYVSVETHNIERNKI